MKNYQKAQMIAKNLPSGSYAAGCPMNREDPFQWYQCDPCERTR